MPGIGQRIDERRRELGLSWTELGERARIDRRTLFNYRKGDFGGCTLDRLARIARALQTGTRELVAGPPDFVSESCVGGVDPM